MEKFTLGGANNKLFKEMDNIGVLDKFEGIEIATENVIPEKDLSFCKLMFDFYKKVYKTYENHLNTMLRLEEEQEQMQESSEEFVNYPHTFIWQYDGISSTETKKTMVHLNNSFVDCICDYFRKKYTITIDSELVSRSIDKCEREPRFCELDEILDKCIIGGLNGCSFIEKAIQEIKDKAKTDRVYSEYLEEWNYDVKGKTIKFRFNINSIKPALYLYDNGGQEIIDCYTHNKIDTYRSFGNGNTDIKFYKSEYAMEFARKYLGYVK